MLSEKGKYASATENRRFVWKEIVWPLILENNDVSFTLKQYQRKRDQVCQGASDALPGERGGCSAHLPGDEGPRDAGERRADGRRSRP